MAKAKLLDRIPVAIEYKILPLLHVKDDLNQAVLKLQGSAVEFNEANKTPVLLSAFIVLRRFCPEIVYHSHESRKRYLVFDNQPVPVLRPDEVVVLKENILDILAAKKKKELKLDLAKIWQKNQDKKLAATLEKCLIEIKKQLKPAETLILFGQAPAVLFLLAQNLGSYDFTKIFYQESEDSKLIKIK